VGPPWIFTNCNGTLHTVWVQGLAVRLGAAQVCVVFWQTGTAAAATHPVRVDTITTQAVHQQDPLRSARKERVEALADGPLTVVHEWGLCWLKACPDAQQGETYRWLHSLAGVQQQVTC
jgi:hypothetical protein